MSDPPPQIPVHVRRLSYEEKAAPDYIAPLGALAVIVSLLGTTCLPLWTVMSLLATGNRGAAGTAATNPATAQAAVPEIPLITLIGVLVFFVIAALGIIGGIASMLRRDWGRRLLLGYAGLVLLYLITAIYFRMRFGIQGLTETAPTASALSLNLTCVFGVLLLVSILMVIILRYFTLPHIVRRFR